MPNDPIEIVANITISSGGSGDGKVKISADDSTPDYLLNKLAGDGINIEELNGGGNEQALIESELLETIVPFTFATTNPMTIRVVEINEYAVGVKLYIDTVFDGTVTLSIGEAGSIERLMAVVDNDPASAGVYETEPGYEYPASTTVRLYLSVTGATQGAGRVLFLSKRP